MEVNDLEEAQGLLNELRNLTKFRVWELLVKDLQEQIEGREQTIHEPLRDMSEIYTHEFLKGEISGLITAVGFPAVAQEDLETAIARLTAEEFNDGT